MTPSPKDKRTEGTSTSEAVEMLAAIRAEYGDEPLKFTAEKSALDLAIRTLRESDGGGEVVARNDVDDFLLYGITPPVRAAAPPAAVSAVPGVDEAMVERAITAFMSERGREYWVTTPALKADMHAALEAALAAPSKE